ncbi:MAG TPA: outer membrane lipoprotein chaperone LolA [Burkholderiales bacterium]|nr:outer membrane lipoprotein chaperone LolA [Burkholderiales bacterium]
MRRAVRLPALPLPVLAMLLCFAMLACMAPARADSIDRFKAFAANTSSARADFEQKVYDRAGRLVQESRGQFVFQRPGRFRWTYEAPVDQLIVGDGERVWIYDKDLQQVTVRRISSALGSTPAALLAGSADVENAFELSDAGSREGLEWLQARPKDREAGFERIRLGFGGPGIETMELTDHFGQTTILRFSNFVRNPPVDPKAFRFEPPPGTDVLGEK